MAVESKISGWISNLINLRSACLQSSAGEELQRLHEGLDLLRQRPVEIGGKIARGQSSVVEIMLASGAAESAALVMLGARPVMLSRGAKGPCMASVVADTGDEEVLCEAATISLALLAAHLSLILKSAGADMMQSSDGDSNPATLH